jgi:hypothetical protein
MAGLGGLAGLGSLAGGISEGMTAEARRRLLQLQAEAQKQQLSGADDAGNALAKTFGSSLAPQASVPGATQFGGGGMLGKLQSMFGGGQGQPQGGGAPPAQPQMSGPSGPSPMAAPQPQARPPMAAPQPQAQGATQPQAGAPRPQMGAPQPQGQGAPPPQVQAALGQMDFPSIIKALSSQPGMTGSRLIAALDRITPFMNAQTQQQYKTAMLGISQQRANTGADSVAERGRHDQATEDISQERESRLSGQFKESIGLVKEKLDFAKSAKSKDEAQRALTDAEREQNRASSLIQNELLYGKDDPDAATKTADYKKQLDDAKAAIAEAKAKLAAMPDNWEGKDQGRAPPEQAKSGEPIKVKTPEDAMKLPPGTVYVTPDGQQYTR